MKVPELAPLYDVCIVGAGPAGLTLALALAGCGRKVLLLETGGIEPSHEIQTLNDGDVQCAGYAGLQSTRRRGLGGTARAWDVTVGGGPGAKYVPLGARDMAGWPFAWSELHPYYVQAQDVCGLGPFEYDAAPWATGARRPFRLENTGLTSAIYQFGRGDRFTRILIDRVAAHESITLATGTAVGFSREAAAAIRGVRVMSWEGQAFEVRARAMVLACGAVENARLLLLEARESGRGSPWLGCCFMEHARDFSLVLTPESPELFAASAFYDLHAAGPEFWVGWRLTLTDSAMEEFALPNASLTLVPRRHRSAARELLDPLLRVAGLARAPVRYGWSHARSPSRVFDVFLLVLNLEQRPKESNRVLLGGRADRFGTPLPRLELAWSEEEQRELERLRELLARWFREAQLGRLSVTPGRPPDLNAHHHAGTTRMAGEPQDGVVDPQGRVFGFDNLYVTGASVFPRAGFANPTLTVVALALRLARHLHRAL
jgi:choline dehydrogenase-like flavoprotein